MVLTKFISRHFAMLRASRSLRKQQEENTSKMSHEDITLLEKKMKEKKHNQTRELGWFLTLLRRFVIYWMGEWDPGQVKAIAREVYTVCPFMFVIPATAASLFAHVLSIQKSRAMGILTDQLAEAGLNTSRTDIINTKSLSTVYEQWPGGIAALQWLAFVMMLEWTCFVTRDILIGKAKTVCALASRTRYFAAMLRQDVAFHNQHSTQELVTRLETDPDCFDSLAVDGVQSGVKGLVSISTLFFLLITDWQLTLLALALRLPQVLQITGRLMQIHTEYERLISHSQSRAQARAAETLRHIAVVQASTAEAREFKGYVALLKECLDIKASSQAVSTVLRNSEDIVLVVTEVTMLAFGGYRVLTGALTVGTFMAYRAYVTHFMTLFAGAEEVYAMVKRANMLSKRLWSIRDRNPSIPLSLPVLNSNSEKAVIDNNENKSPTHNTSLTLSSFPDVKCHGEVKFEDVWFQYASGGEVLRGVNFSVSAGSVVAIVGPSGSGKSTLAKLLLRFYDPSKGQISMDGNDLKSLDVRRLRRMVGMVDQDATVLDRSVRENIAFGLVDPELDSVLGLGEAKPETLCANHITSPKHENGTPKSASSPSSHSSPANSTSLRQRLKAYRSSKSVKEQTDVKSPRHTEDVITMEDIERAATQANAHEFIMALDQGYDTTVGPSRLSGGQRQRLAIARCILRNPAVLVLDEATSSLDSRTEASVQKALEELMKGRTAFIIAHRLATVKQASVILVLDKGRVVEQGTHQEILQKFPQGIYSSLLQHQQLLSTK